MNDGGIVRSVLPLKNERCLKLCDDDGRVGDDDGRVGDDDGRVGDDDGWVGDDDNGYL